MLLVLCITGCVDTGFIVTITDTDGEVILENCSPPPLHPLCKEISSGGGGASKEGDRVRRYWDISQKKYAELRIEELAREQSSITSI